MRIGMVEILGAEEVNNTLEKELEKEVSTLEIKRFLVPTLDDAAFGSRKLVEDMQCDAVVIGYPLEENEKPSHAFQNSILYAQYQLKKNIFRVIIPHGEDFEHYAQEAAKEIIRYFYKPSELQHEKSAMHDGDKNEKPFNPFAMFG